MQRDDRGTLLTTRPARTGSHRLFRALEQNTAWVVVAVLVLTAVVAVPFLTMAPDNLASTEPGGAVFDARDSVGDRFVSSVYITNTIAVADGGDLLLADPLRALLEAEDALRVDPELGPTLFRYFSPDAETNVLGVLSIADLVDAELAGVGGLAAATDAQVKTAGTAVIDRFGAESELLSLSQQSFQNANGDWVVPAIVLRVLSDDATLGFGTVSINLGGDTAPEHYSRDVLSVLAAADGWNIKGLGIDVNLTSEEQGEVAGPFIGLTVLAVLLLVGLTFRSYWVLAVVSSAFLLLLIWLKGISNLIGFKDDLVLSLIVPIAMISFGVDYAFHAIGRYREERASGAPPNTASIAGAAAVSGALVLATASDSVAFLANVTAGIESIVQFGIGAAIALFSAYLLLGLVAPFVIAAIEGRFPVPEPGWRAAAVRVVGAIAASIMAVASVMFLVFLGPWVGVALTAQTILVTLVVPLAIQDQRVAKATARPGLTSDEQSMARRIGAVVGVLAAQRRIVLPVAVLITAVATVFAVQLPARFDVEDFFAADTDFVQGLDLIDDHVGLRDGEPAILYIEGDLADPSKLAMVATHIEKLRDAESAALAQTEGRARVLGYGIFDIFENTWTSPVMADAVAERTGVRLTDVNGDAIPDTREQIVALTTVAAQIGVPFDNDNLAMTPDDVSVRTDFPDVGAAATQVIFAIANSRDQGSVRDARELLDGTARAIGDDLDGAFVHATGSAIVREASLEGVSRALLVSLPVAVIACFAVASTFLRSIRLGLASVVPILMVVAWLYAFMEILGYSINMVTATIAAVSVGIGIDFALHYISRYREELARLGRREEAASAAGTGTGMALVASAISSAVGFAILAFAPMPLFAAYGLLTAVMIMMALIATLAVLPGLLIAITHDTAAAGS